MKSLIRNASVAATALLLGLSATAIARADDKPTLAFVVNGASDFWKAAEAGMKKAQGELPDYTLEFKYPGPVVGRHPAGADGRSRDRRRQGHHGFGRRSEGRPTCSTRSPGETALFTTDSRRAADSKRIAYIGSSNVDAGKQAAEIAKKAMPNGAKCMGFVGLLDAANYKERAQGFNEGLKGTKITLVDTRGDDIDQTRAKKNVEDVLAANPDINCMVGFYSYNTPRIYEALKDAGKLGSITVVGFDDDPITLGGVKEGTIAGTVVQQPFEWAYQGFKLMAAVLKGDKSGIPANGQLIIPTKILVQGRHRRLRRQSQGDVGQVRPHASGPAHVAGPAARIRRGPARRVQACRRTGRPAYLSGHDDQRCRRHLPPARRPSRS